MFAPSLKAPDAARWLADRIATLKPAAIVNATAFSGKGADGTSPLDAGGVPVFQVALSTSDRAAWDGAERGLSPADLAMHVVLPEVDGRIFAGVASFKEMSAPDPDLQIALARHQPDPERIEAIADRVGVINNGELLIVDDKITLMHELGKRQLVIHLEETIDTMPTTLSSWALELSTDGDQLTYTYDPREPHTGIAELLPAITDAGLLLKDVDTSQSSLEEIFINLVNADS